MSKESELKEFILEKAPQCVHKAGGMLAHPFVTPSFDVEPGADDAAEVSERSSVGHYLQMYDWDACFFSQATHRLTLDIKENIGMSVVQNFMSIMEPDGHTPRTVAPERIWDAGDHCKPFLAQSLAYQKRMFPALEIDTKLLASLDKYLDYFKTHRGAINGLFHWRNVLESGVDNNYTLLFPLEASKDTNENVGDYPDAHLIATDICGYIYGEYKAMEELYTANGDKTSAEKYERMASDLASAIDQYLWVEEIGMHCNLDSKTGRHVTLRSWTSLVPAIMGACAKERTKQVIEQNMLNENHFLSPCGISSVALSERLCNQAKRGLYGRYIVSNWQGPMWVIPNALVVRCLKREGYMDGARDISHRVTHTMLDGITSTGTLYENYDALHGYPLWAPQFMSWNILALELIETLEN